MVLRATARLASRAAVLTAGQFLGRLESKGILIGDRQRAFQLLMTVGYTHIVRYVPMHAKVRDFRNERVHGGVLYVEQIKQSVANLFERSGFPPARVFGAPDDWQLAFHAR